MAPLGFTHCDSFPFLLTFSKCWYFFILLCADRERIALGTEDGLFVVEVTRDGETDRQTDELMVEVTCHDLT